jgi:diguanylate cyclase (GGDEF)-like protein
MTGPVAAAADDRAADGPDLAAFAADWARAVAGTSYIPLARGELTQLLSAQLAELVEACGREPFSTEPGYRVAEQLVAADIASPEALGRTIRVLGDEVADEMPLPARQRMRALLAEFATAYARALCDRTLDAQEQIRRAALASRDEAVKALHASEARFRHAALHDPLTGLPNRAMLVEQLAHTINAADQDRLVALCVLDVDHFKVVNDTHGHAAGDDLLRTLAQRLRQVAQPGRWFLARIGGDEFALLTTGEAGDEPGFDRVVGAALEAVAEPAPVAGHRMVVRASAGLVVRPTAQTLPAELLRAADVSLHWAKSDGRGRWVAHSSDRDQLQTSQYRLASQLPAALERNQIVPVYQPIVNLADMTVVGAEALARWHHPYDGEIPPNNFIGLAEQTGHVVALGRSMLRQACRAAAGWPVPYDQAFVSVNIAAPHVHDHDITADVQDALAESGLHPSRLVLEITETLATHTSPDVIAKLRKIADMGIRIAIDDFGTGYSNFDYLRTLPVHLIKLDTSFVKDLAAGPNGNRLATSIVTTLIRLAHTLDLSTIAEGIETPAQAQILRDLGCDSGQGWYLGRPRPSLPQPGA